MAIEQHILDQVFQRCVERWRIDLPQVELEYNQGLFTVEPVPTPPNGYQVSHNFRPDFVIVIEDDV